MPFVLKEPSSESKGILVVTHKERLVFARAPRLMEKLFRKVRDKWVVAMHWGWHHTNVRALPYVDVHLAATGTLQFAPGQEQRRIDICSRNFTASCFRPMGLTKIWDIICVARAARWKNLDQFLSAVRCLYDRGRAPRVLIVCSAPLNADSHVFHTDIRSDFDAMFSDEERKNMSLIFMRDGYPFPLPLEQIALFYNLSRCFALFSDKEGESRVVAEALLCGLPVVAKAKLLGGGRDYLSPANSRLFEGVEGAADAFEEILDHPERYAFDSNVLRKELSEDVNTLRLQQEFERLFAELGLQFLGKLRTEDLGRALPGHRIELPKKLRMEVTNDLRNCRAALVYLSTIADCSTTMSDRAEAVLADLASVVSRGRLQMKRKLLSLIPKSVRKVLWAR